MKRTLQWLGVAALALAPAAAQEDDGRFYLGAGLDIADHSARQDGIGYDDSPLGAVLYGGVQVRDRFAVEAALQSFPSVGSGTIPGSGIRRLRIDSAVDTVVVRAVVSLNLADVFTRAARWSVFATAGAFALDDSRRVSDLTFGTTTDTTADETGFALGGGALYDLPRLRLRAALEQRDGGDTQQTSLGVTAEFRF